MIDKLDKEKNILISEINFLKRQMKNFEKFNYVESIIQRLKGIRELSNDFTRNIKNFQLVFENSVEINREIMGIDRNI
jgi:hypothetical protein